MTQEEASEKLRDLYLEGLMENIWYVEENELLYWANKGSINWEFADKLDDLEIIIYGRPLAINSEIEASKEFKEAYEIYNNIPLLAALK
jgi:hypothetical protein